jgi:stage II sporulation protein D
MAPSAQSAQGAVTWVVHGAGFGHGVGMGAYGAYGYAKHGFTANQILTHYFTGTQVTTLKTAPIVRVLLKVSAGDVSFTKATHACGQRLNSALSYRASRFGVSVRLLSPSGTLLARCGKRLHASGAGTIQVGAVGTYRGALEVVPASGALNVINAVDVNDYAQGVLPGEIFPSWPEAALEAFAIAARSIALSTHVGGAGFDLYPDTRTQVYAGFAKETDRTNNAVRATLNQVVMYNGQVAQTLYCSSSGGRTESGFLGAPPVPYLKSVDDPYDYYAPLHRWTVRFTEAQMNARLAPYLRGSLRQIVVTKRGDSPRIDFANLVGSGGTTSIRGDTLAAALGLYDRWASFQKVGG